MPALMGEFRSDLALRRDGRQEAQRMLQRIGRGGETRVRQPRRHHAGMRRAAGVIRLGHGAEVGDQPRAMRGAERKGMRGLVRVEPAQRCARCGRRDGAEDAGRVPALLVVLSSVAADKLGPDLEAGNIGRRQPRAADAEGLAFRQDRRHQHRARMAAQRHVVVVEGMRGGGVDQRCVRRGDALTRQVQAGVARRGRQHLAQDLRRLLHAARDHGADAVGKTGADHGERRRRHGIEAHLGYEAGERAGQCLGHCHLHRSRQASMNGGGSHRLSSETGTWALAATRRASPRPRRPRPI